MTGIEWYCIYCGGSILTSLGIIMNNGDRFIRKKHPRYDADISIIACPLLLPMSIYALIGKFLYLINIKTPYMTYNEKQENQYGTQL